MQTLTKLLQQVIDSTNEACNNSLSSIGVEEAANTIDDYLRDIWDGMLGDSNDPWRVIMQAFVNTHSDAPEDDDAVTFISYIILTQSMLKDKKNAIRSQS